MNLRKVLMNKNFTFYLSLNSKLDLLCTLYMDKEKEKVVGKKQKKNTFQLR